MKVLVQFRPLHTRWQSQTSTKSAPLAINVLDVVDIVYYRNTVLPHAGTMHVFQIKSRQQMYHINVFVRPSTKQETYHLTIDDNFGDFWGYTWDRPQNPKGPLSHLLQLLVAHRTHQFKEELIQKVFHPSQIQQRLNQGRSLDDAFQT